ncbi:SLC13 family permease [Aeromonas veronii]|uniref:SLC13 family permease n=1 Tax=Aeromonas veronii TaxID=654 RepID=UPI0024445709|nr:SLC13 family permease [Aeromonas veronii]
MTSEALWVLLIFLMTLAALAYWHHRAEKIFGCALLVLYISGVISSDDLIASAANQGLVTLVLLLCTAFVLERTFLLQRITSWMLASSFTGSWWRVMLSALMSSAFLNNTAIVSILLGPLRASQQHPGRRLILPMTYVVSIGGMLTLVGTSTNLIVNTMMLDAGLEGLHLMDFFPVGVIAAALGLAWLWIARNLLPNDKLDNDALMPYLLEARVSDNSSMIGKTVAQAGLRHLQRLFLVEIIRRGSSLRPIAPGDRLEAGDTLLFSGDPTAVGLLSRFSGLDNYAERHGIQGDELTEVLVLPDSPLCGCMLKDTDFRAKFDAAVVAMRRNGETLSGSLGEKTLQGGDFLVLATGLDFSNRNNLAKNFLIIRGAKPTSAFRPLTEWLMIGGFVLAITLSALGWVSLLKAMVCYFGLLLSTGVFTLNELRRRFPFGLWLIVMAALALAKAMEGSGLMGYVSSLVKVALQDVSPYVALIGVLFVTWCVTELVTNNATAAMMTPVALAVAQGLDVSPLPFVMVVAYASSCSFINPYAYQTNLMAFRAGEYGLGDYIRLGLPLSILYLVAIVCLVPLIFPF